MTLMEKQLSEACTRWSKTMYPFIVVTISYQINPSFCIPGKL